MRQLTNNDTTTVFDKAATRAASELNGLDRAIDLLKQEKPVKCKGLIFRCEISAYIGKDGSVSFKERYRPLKTLSCLGCEQCGYMLDDLHESVNGSHIRDNIIHNGQDGKLYKLKVVNISHDWETGYIDDWDLEFVEYKEDENETSVSVAERPS